MVASTTDQPGVSKLGDRERTRRRRNRGKIEALRTNKRRQENRGEEGEEEGEGWQ